MWAEQPVGSDITRQRCFLILTLRPLAQFCRPEPTARLVFLQTVGQQFALLVREANSVSVMCEAIPLMFKDAFWVSSLLFLLCPVWL